MARGHAKTAALHQRESVSFAFDTDIGAVLRQWADKIKEEALRPAAAAAAEVLYNEMRLLVPVFKGSVYRNTRGKSAGNMNANPGQLRDAIYQWRDTKQSNADRQVYVIGANKRKAPHWALVEFGTSKMFARSYIRKAWENKSAQAFEAARKRLEEKISEIAGRME